MSKKPFELIYPEHGAQAFSTKITSLDEYSLYAAQPIVPITQQDEFEKNVQRSCTTFEKTEYQHFVQHYISRRSPYKSLLLFHGLGTGKSCSSITIAEALLTDHSQNEEPRILVVSSSALQESFKDQIFASTRFLEFGDSILENQCTRDTYRKLVHGTTDREVIRKRIQQLIQKRYEFITYDGLKSYSEKRKLEPIKHKLIIVDEAHNLRQSEKQKNETQKAAAKALVKLIEKGEDNRLILLSATPMYNEPDEIFWLLSLLIKNDKRSNILQKPELYHLFNIQSIQDDKAFQLLKELANEYISYVRGTNPFTFPVRLSPVINGDQIIKDAWAKDILDGLIPTKLGTSQKGMLYETDITEGDTDTEGESSETIEKSTNKLTVLLQLANITYPNDTRGSNGFKTVFNRRESPQFQVEYKKGYENLLAPVPEKLGDIASKMFKICNYIQNAEGIVVIYSQFVWAGVIPLSIALEHMGFKRYMSPNNSQNMLILTPQQQSNAQTLNVPYAKYKDIRFPSYCILSSDNSDVMGNTKIHEILQAVNHPNNKNGSRVKVVLMTPIAAEGLNFKNAREIHVLDPWYHMNRLEQVIGRTIRTCSHSGLPIEERNVTVYLHTTVPTDSHKKGETVDVHAYKIAARKLFEIHRAETTIRNSALDCDLMKNINYYPKDIFQFTIQMKTSQNKQLVYSFGDDPTMKPSCVETTISKRSLNLPMYEENVENLIPTIIQKIKRHILPMITTTSYISTESIVTELQIDKSLVVLALHRMIYPTQVITNYYIYPHNNGIIISPEIKKINKVELKIPSIEQVEVEETYDLETLLSPTHIPSQDYHVATYKLYTDLDSKSWQYIAKKFIETRSPLIDRFGQYLARVGALIRKSEVPAIQYDGAYVGYVNIFNITDFEISLYNPVLKNYRDPTELELKNIKSNRIEFVKPIKQTYGILMPRKNKKNPADPLRNELKIIAGGGLGKGAECSTKKWNEINELIKEFNIDLKKTDTTIKDTACFTLGVEMFKQGALLLYPEWKPKTI
jgi:hypothetical protein